MALWTRPGLLRSVLRNRKNTRSTSLCPSSAQQPARRDRPDRLDAPSPVSDDLVVQVGGPTGVIDDHLDTLADLGLAVALAQVDVAVLFGLGVGDRLGVIR